MNFRTPCKFKHAVETAAFHPQQQHRDAVAEAAPTAVLAINQGIGFITLEEGNRLAIAEHASFTPRHPAALVDILQLN